MTREQFEALLDKVVEILNDDVVFDMKYHDASVFEKRVRQVLEEAALNLDLTVNPTHHPHAFPDIRANGFGVEVKTVKKDSWLSVGNSVFEGMRDDAVEDIYVVFGKFGGMPGVRWKRYEECITHVRISHAPRFVIEMDRDSRLFDHVEVSYDEFSELSPHDKMEHIRQYSRNRLKPGERLWWLEDDDSSIPVEIRIYMDLSQSEKRQLRAEAALLCPQICGGSRERTKYYDVSTYLLRAHGVLAPQTRDLYSAGSVGAKQGERGGSYMQRALKDIGQEMRHAAVTLDDALFEEYWGTIVPQNERIETWLSLADRYARSWKPSDHLFVEGKFG